MIQIKRHNAIRPGSGWFIVCAVRNGVIIKSWPDQAAITDGDLNELESMDTVKSWLYLTNVRLKKRKRSDFVG